MGAILIPDPMNNLDATRLTAEKQRSLSDVVYQKIMSLITDGSFAESGKLPSELALAQRFMVSRPTVRQALSRLRADGLIASQRGSGSFVQLVQDQLLTEHAPYSGISGFHPIESIADVERCFDLRIGVEGEAAASAALARTDKQIDALWQSIERLMGSTGSGTQNVEADLDFHLQVAAASANHFFVFVIESLREQMSTSMTLAHTLSSTRYEHRLDQIFGQHKAVVEAIERRDGARARSEMRKHLEHAKRRLLEGAGDISDGGVSAFRSGRPAK